MKKSPCSNPPAPRTTAKPIAASVRKLRASPAENVSFDIREGEILGLTGLIGSGFDRVPEAIFGAQKDSDGTLEIGGKSFALNTMSPGKAMGQGVAFLPADRLGRAGIGTLSIAENMILPVMGDFRNLLGIDWGKINTHVFDMGRKYDIRPNRPYQDLKSLSGGNAQKVLMAKWLQTLQAADAGRTHPRRRRGRAAKSCFRPLTRPAARDRRCWSPRPMPNNWPKSATAFLSLRRGRSSPN
ncbi:MAG: ATP-binding cassette domain-containing protein [Thalassovita sp.]